MVGKAVDTTVPSMAGRSAVTDSAVMIAQYRHPFTVPVSSVVACPGTIAISDSPTLDDSVTVCSSIVMSLFCLGVQIVFVQ